MRQIALVGLSAALIALASAPALPAGQYGPGVSDTEIKLGNTTTAPSASRRPPISP